MLRLLALTLLLGSATAAHAQSATDAAVDSLTVRGESFEDDLDGYVMIEPTVETFGEDGYFTLDLEVEAYVQYFFHVVVPEDQTYGSPWVVVEDAALNHIASAANEGSDTDVDFTPREDGQYTISVSTQSCTAAPCSFVYMLLEVDLDF